MEEKNSEKKERKMRDSGIPWIGEVPEGWGVNKIKYHLTRNEIKNKPDKQVLSVYRDYGVIPKDSRDDNHNVTSEDTSKYKYVQKGDLVINKMKAWQGSLGVSEYEGIVSPAYYIYKFHDNCFEGKFFHYLIRGCYKDEFRRISGGIREGQWDLSAEKFENTMIIIPPVQEQHRIADFLDSKCAEIDILIENLHARIESAKEYKKAVITEAVTKGLDKNAKMKDSGVEWIGEIPERWKVGKIKQFCILKTGKTPSTQNKDMFDGPLNWYTPADFSDTYTLSNASRTLSQKAEKSNDIVIIPPNSVMLIGIGGTAGKVGLTCERCSCNQQVTAIITNKMFYKYLMYYMVGNSESLKGIASYTTLPILNNQIVGNYPVLIPEQEEQHHIADYLDYKCSEIDALLQNYENQIATLEEYKKSLIYEYVTGKKEVPAA